MAAFFAQGIAAIQAKQAAVADKKTTSFGKISSTDWDLDDDGGDGYEDKPVGQRLCVARGRASFCGCVHFRKVQAPAGSGCDGGSTSCPCSPDVHFAVLQTAAIGMVPAGHKQITQVCLYCSRASGLLPVPALCISAGTGGLRVSVGLAFMSLRDLTCGCSRLQMRCKGIWRRRWALPLCLLLWRPLLMLMSSPRSCVVGPAERPAHVSADGGSHEAI